jgi:hypothetical protein
LGYGTSASNTCSECCNLTSKHNPVKAGKNDEEKLKNELKPNKFIDEKPNIPGLVLGANVKNTKDINLAPYTSNGKGILQYGNTTFSSINTDDPNWAPGECLHLEKYEGNFRMKTTGKTQQVNYIFYIDK